MHIERFEVVKRRAEMALHGNTVYIGGQVADDPSGDIQDQTRQILENIDRLLQSVGSDRGQVLSVRILLAHREDYAGLNQVWDQWFPRRPGADPRLQPGRVDRPALAGGNDRRRRPPAVSTAMTFRPFWLDQALRSEHAAPCLPLAGDTRADVHRRRRLHRPVDRHHAQGARSRLDVVLVEADLCGAGASGRNGGCALSWSAASSPWNGCPD